MAYVEKTWSGIKDWFKTNRPEVLETLNVGAQPADFAALEQYFPRLPAEFYTLYHLNNGQTNTFETGVFLGLPMLPLERVVQEWQANREVIE